MKVKNVDQIVGYLDGRLVCEMMQDYPTQVGEFIKELLKYIESGQNYTKGQIVPVTINSGSVK